MSDRNIPDEDVPEDIGYVAYECIEHAAEVLEGLDKDLRIEGVLVANIVDMLNELLERRDGDEPMDDATRYALGAM